MSYQILDSDFSDFISTTDGADTSVNGEQGTQIQLASKKGEIHYQTQVLHQHISIQSGNYYIQDDVCISGKGDNALLELQINLSEKAITYRDKSGTEQVTPAKSGNMVYLSANDNMAQIFFQKDTSYHTFDIHLPVSLLSNYAGESRLMDHFLENIEKDISSMLSPNMVWVNPAIYNTIQEIKTCKHEGLTRKLYLESKVYEMIALLYDNAENARESRELNSGDKERIHWAASIIQNNLETPCSIIDLARQVGINQTKLKTGFKSIFGNTVFGYLQDIRMHHAKKYLLDTELSIQEISMLLGYQNASNFSIAFKKIHGYSPIKMREK